MTDTKSIEHRKLIEDLIKSEVDSVQPKPAAPKPAGPQEKRSNEEYRRILQRFINSDTDTDKLSASRR